MNIDAHARPPDNVRAVHRAHQKPSSSAADLPIFDNVTGNHAGFVLTDQAQSVLGFDPTTLSQTFESFTSKPHLGTPVPEVYTHPEAPGLFVFPALLSAPAQLHLLNTLFHRDLSNPHHKTNLHPHYEIPYPPAPAPSTSFFTLDAQKTTFKPHDTSIHKPQSLHTILTKKLRWMTLGGQYDWTAKHYPAGPPPSFPQDTATLVSSLFPAMTPQAAICNVYSPGDTLAPHRDVSETCERPLASISLGCDCVFVVARSDAGTDADIDAEAPVLTLRLHSGDVLVMAGPARTAWHGVPRIERGTCPGFMSNWPVDESAVGTGEYREWKGWMANKRINLNVRQMWEV